MDFLKDLSIDKVRNLAEDAFNQAKPKTDLEAKVYEILSHKNWGASSTIMNEIARDTFDYEKFSVITMLMWEAMENQRPAAWRVVFKGLTLLEHLVKNGSERCVDDARNHGHTLRSLSNFNYYEGTIDRGLGVREKTKQIMELLQDDERIREERQKARKLREKFGGNLGGTGNAGGGGGAYAGYGNDNWNSGGGYGNGGIGSDSGGYGNGGIGSSRYSEGGGGGGRYDEDRGYSGRYDNDTSAPAASTPAPTFASIPDDPPKKTKAKKKKNKEPQPAAPEVDLFSFDAPAPAATPAPAEEDDFAGFQSAEAPAASAAPTAVDPFAAAPQMQNQQQNQFDAFGGATQPQQSFGAFASAPQAASAGPVMNGGLMQQQSQFAPNTVMGGGNQMMGGSMNVMGGSSHVMGGSMSGSAPMNQASISQPAVQKKSDFDDDFGDFSGAGGAATSAVPMSGNPVDKLISLDGLSKNSDKKKDKMNEPIIANQAAATFVQERDQIQASVKQANKGSHMSFAGIDGLNKTAASSFGGNQQMMMNNMAPAMSMGMNPSVMGSGGTAASTIGMLDPNALSGPLQSQPQQMQQQGMAMNPQMAMGGMAMNGGMQQGFQGMGMQSGNPGMMNNQSMGFNPSMMGGQTMGMGGMPASNMNNFGAMQSGMNQQQQQQQGFR